MVLRKKHFVSKTINVRKLTNLTPVWNDTHQLVTDQVFCKIKEVQRLCRCEYPGTLGNLRTGRGLQEKTR